MKKIFPLFLALILIFVTVGKVEAAAPAFNDVPENHPNYSAIMYLVHQGVVAPDGRFGPNDKVTREEVAVMVAKAIGLDGTKTKTKFKDVPASRFSSGYINSAVKAGILNGYPDGTFKPTQYVTRGHMAAFIANGFKLTQEANINFKDVPKGSTSYNAVRKLVAANITSGYPDGTFKPNQTLTRSHIAAFIARAMEPSFRPQQHDYVVRDVYFGMTIQQVQAAETAKLMDKVVGPDTAALVYKLQVTNAGGNPKITYYFANGKLNLIGFDFFGYQKEYASWKDLEQLHYSTLLSLRKSLGKEWSYSSNGYSKATALWNTGSYKVLLIAENDGSSQLRITYYAN
ncbi:MULTISPECIES: S-layer homology domain-containing protein [unclassified Sporosarcina]|uniref:S-layer homology domain-containing protein n=1 Tax=unclassified Sporosarcina TaxID=2647733 RepID=UPI00203B8630|nr:MULTISPECIES: S-layer homology domain-containing protein [unclassified Sporosarcina]GKV65551.1 hypothetical protein NCCP2331_17040 [Sporosarcina sp. NCCP-2331]GLB55676.1 hypothetical protein NCCP2378_14630 [Sporosarcina sp. NCCP-2378]